MAVLNQNSERELLELDSSGNQIETSLVGSGFTQINGMARNSSTGKIYVTNSNAQAGVLLIDDGKLLPIHSMAINSITAKADTTATFTGSIDPQGATLSGCNFQYSTDQLTWTTVPVVGCSSLSPGGGVQAVSTNVTNLIPSTKYYVRLAVNSLFIPGTSLTAVRSFTTDAAPPIVSNVGAIDASDTSLRLVGQI